jgi:hypothetical protein
VTISRVFRFIVFTLATSSILAATARADTLTVQVNLSFDRSIPSDLVKTVVRDEVTAIWKAYGVELLWADGNVEAAFHLNVIVGRHAPSAALGRSQQLGLTRLDRSGVVCGPILIWTDTVEALLQQQPITALTQDRALGRALARVLAHELGHALLGIPTYHDRDGLMRASFAPEDLARADRHPFQLMPASIDRLRDRIERLSGTQRPVSSTDTVLDSGLSSK